MAVDGRADGAEDAMPSAPPNSVPVSSSDEAAPAFSTGAAPSARSAIWDMTATTPQARTPHAASSSHRESVPVRASSAKPHAATAKPRADDVGAVNAPLDEGGALTGAASSDGYRGQQAPQRRLQGPLSEHRLDVLGGEVRRAHHAEGGDEVEDDGRAEAAAPEQCR